MNQEFEEHTVNEYTKEECTVPNEAVHNHGSPPGSANGIPESGNNTVPSADAPAETATAANAADTQKPNADTQKPKAKSTSKKKAKKAQKEQEASCNAGRAPGNVLSNGAYSQIQDLMQALTTPEGKQMVSQGLFGHISEVIKNLFINGPYLDLPVSNALNTYVEMNWKGWKPSTQTRYYTYVNCQLIPLLGQLQMSQLTAEVLDQYVETLRNKHVSEKTIRETLVFLKGMLKKTYPVLRLLLEFPDVPGKSKEARALSGKDRERLQLHLLCLICKEPKKKLRYKRKLLGILIALQTGMRAGEVCALRYCDVDLVRGTVSIEATVGRVNNKENKEKGIGPATEMVRMKPKTESSERIIPLNAMILLILKLFPCNDPYAYLVSGTQQIPDPSVLNKFLQTIAVDANLDEKDIHMHLLRHTYATDAIASGIDIKVVSELLGHNSTKTTYDRYVHNNEEIQRRAVNKLSDMHWSFLRQLPRDVLCDLLGIQNGENCTNPDTEIFKLIYEQIFQQFYDEFGGKGDPAVV